MDVSNFMMLITKQFSAAGTINIVTPGFIPGPLTRGHNRVP